MVDVAVPIPCAIPIEDKKISRRSTAFHIFAIRPMGGSRYLVERSHHPRRSIFTLLDIPIKMDAYKQAVENDYDKTGYFLDCVIILKVIGDKLWRFSSRDKPYKLEGFEKTNREEQILSPDDLSGPLASHFGISASKIAAAVSYLPVQGLAR